MVMIKIGEKEFRSFNDKFDKAVEKGIFLCFCYGLGGKYQDKTKNLKELIVQFGDEAIELKLKKANQDVSIEKYKI